MTGSSAGADTVLGWNLSKLHQPLTPGERRRRPCVAAPAAPNLTVSMAPGSGSPRTALCAQSIASIVAAHARPGRGAC